MCKTYYDGIDCRILRKGNGAKERWSSHKFNKKPAVRYGVATCIQTGWIVAVHGPFPAGQWNDQKIFKGCCVPHLEPGEMCKVDKGFWGPAANRPLMYHCVSERRAKKAAALRHETINGRLKNFRSLFHAFRHPVRQHILYFMTAAIVSQLMFEQYGTTFQVMY